MKFNERLKELRIMKCVSQQEVASFLGLTQKAYCFYELGTREPSLNTLSKLCDYFDVTSDYLLGRSDNY
ncbi:MAG: helix-turn-helix domain-containing protein [Clostridia bacterium]|nr:helix-turn-helix domain-containing protein [Clostridia bacterium]